jgi:hypothetical protein
VVKALDFKPEGSGFEARWSEILNLPNPSGHTRPWSSLSLQQKWERKTLKKKFLWSTERPGRKAGNLTAICEPIV